MALSFSKIAFIISFHNPCFAKLNLDVPQVTVTNLVALFEGFAALDEHPVDGPHPRADHDGGGGGEPEGTGARDAQHRDGQLERVREDRFVVEPPGLLSAAAGH